jgi:uncharacterized damage-inducible protein DinB
MPQFLNELFLYNHHSNQKLFEVLNGNQNIISDKAIKLFNHIINSHQIWNKRIIAEQTLPAVWEVRPFGELGKIDSDNYRQSLKILEEKEITETIHYANSKGEKFSNTVGDILFHVINHSTYHRAQINMELRSSGIEPVVTDYIVYKRQ